MAPQVILYHYSYSPYAHKITFYLSLRPSIPYTQCLQPPVIPRPDLQALNITYRRIPVLALGNTILCDTDNIIDALETVFPGSHLAHADAAKWSAWADALFPHAAALLPKDMPLLKDPRFLRDRADYADGWAPAQQHPAARRKAAIEAVRKAFGDVEAALTGKWLGGEKVSLADLNAVWVLEWLITLPGALKGSGVNAAAYPRVFDWVKRFMAKVGAARGDTIGGQQAKKLVLGGERVDLPVGEAEEGWRVGEKVEVVPVDTGRKHPQRGEVWKVGKGRVVLKVAVEGASVKVCFPRAGYEVRRVKESKL